MRPLWDAAFKNTEAKNKGASGGPLALPAAPYALWHVNPSSRVSSGFRKMSDANCSIPGLFFGITEGRSGRGHHRACTSPWRAARHSQQHSQAQGRSWLKLLRHRPWKVSAVAVWPGQRWAAWLQLDKSLENAQQGRRQQQAACERPTAATPHALPAPEKRTRGDSLGESLLFGVPPPPTV